jgi:hypothetical protein
MELLGYGDLCWHILDIALLLLAGDFVRSTSVRKLSQLDLIAYTDMFGALI